MTEDDIRAWDAELTATFSVGGVVAAGLLPVIRDAERIAGEAFANKYRGHTKAMDCLFDFFAGTLSQLTRYFQMEGWPSSERYAVLLLMYATLFRTLRAADAVARSGHFYHAYSVHRSVKDQAFAIAAVVNKITSTDDMFGWTDPSEETNPRAVSMEKVVKKRQIAEKRAEDFILGKSSGLSQAHQDELLMWSRMFNWQAHRGLMTYYEEIKRLVHRGAGGGTLDLRPLKDEQSETMFINRSDEMAWLVIRLLPFLQTEGAVFSPDWRKKWDVLDRTFTMFNAEFTSLGKPLGEAFAAMVAAKFNFTPDTRYSE